MLSKQREPTHTATGPSDDAVQAITTAPDVTVHPLGGFMVYFGTGRLFDSADATNTAVQSIYGIWDKDDWGNGQLPTESGLVTQTLTEKVFTTDTGFNLRVRVATDNPVSYTTDPTATQKGWRVNLPAGERLIEDPLLRDRRLQFKSVNPTLPTGENWFVHLDFLSGGAPPKVIIDINGDGSVDTNDNVDGNGDGDITDKVDRVVAQYQSFGLASRPNIVAISATQDSALINHLHAINPANLPPTADDPGLKGGHIDVDTSHLIYPFSAGTTNHHTHEWDDGTGLTSINFMRFVDKICTTLGNESTCPYPSSFDDIQERITDPNKKFRIIVANSRLSPGGVIEINGASQTTTQYEQKVAQFLGGTASALPVYKLGAPTPREAAAGVKQLTSFKLSIDTFAILTGGIIPTETGCVRNNTPGKLGEYRNAALLIQAVDATSGTVSSTASSSAQSAASSVIHDTLHYTTKGLLWETTVFWHWKGGCYSDSGWQSLYDQCIIGQDFTSDACKAAIGADEKVPPSKDKTPPPTKSHKKKKDKAGTATQPPPQEAPPPPPQEVPPASSSPGVANPGFEVTNTTGSGDNQTGRLLWRELVF